MRYRILHDSDHFHAPIDEDHIQRNERILHPESLHLILLKDEEHAGFRCQFLSVHQASGTLLVAPNDLNWDSYGPHFARNDDGSRLAWGTAIGVFRWA